MGKITVTVEHNVPFYENWNSQPSNILRVFGDKHILCFSETQNILLTF